MMNDPAAVECQIHLGGFSGEKVVKVGRLSAMAPTGLCWTTDDRMLTNDEPSSRFPMPGKVACRVIDLGEDKNQAYIECPDGSRWWVYIVMVVDRPQSIPAWKKLKNANKRRRQ